MGMLEQVRCPRIDPERVFLVQRVQIEPLAGHQVTVLQMTTLGQHSRLPCPGQPRDSNAGYSRSSRKVSADDTAARRANDNDTLRRAWLRRERGHATAVHSTAGPLGDCCHSDPYTSLTYTSFMAMTTIRVETELRDRLAAQAAANGRSLGAELRAMMDEMMWQGIEAGYRRLAASREEMAAYQAEAAEWTSTGLGHLASTAAGEYPEYNS